MSRYSVREDLLSDIIGGSTIGMVCLAQTLAHAAIATTNAIQGPYCAFVPAIVYAFMGTSPHASVSSGAIAAIIIADQLVPWPDINDRTAMASLLALISGATLVMVGVCKLSFAVRFLSQPTISGFVTGGAILIVTQQFKNLFGFIVSPVECEEIRQKRLDEGASPPICRPYPEGDIFPHTDHFVDLVKVLIEFSGHIMLESLLLGLLFMVMLDLFNRAKAKANGLISAASKKKPPAPPPKWAQFVKRFAEMKEIIVVCIAASIGFFTRNEHGHPAILCVGKIPQGLPPYNPPWDSDEGASYSAAAMGLWHSVAPKIGSASAAFKADPTFRDPDIWVYRSGMIHSFCVGGMLVAFTTFLTTYATTKKMSLKKGYVLDPAQEMIGLGCAGIGGSFFGAFPPSGSLSRTGLADDCGVKTQMGGIFCAGIIGLGLTFLTPILYFLPKTTLAAIIIMSTKGLIDFSTPKGLLKFWRPQSKGGLKRDFIVWCVAFVFTIFLGVLEGIGIAVVLSIGLVVADAAAPDAVVLGNVEKEKTALQGRKWRNIKDWPNSIRYPGIFIFEFRGPLSFASAEWFEERVEKYRKEEEASSGHNIKYVVLSFQSVHHLDYTAIKILEELLSLWKKRGLECIIAEAKASVRLLIEQELHQRCKLFDQTGFMLSVSDAVELARHKLNAHARVTVDGACTMSGCYDDKAPRAPSKALPIIPSVP
jgi:MFS superfamily sulfate permease-like transporter